MGKPDYPTPPDPNVVANAQTGSNLETAKANAELNRVTQNTPYGSSNWSVTGTNPDGTPNYQQDITLSQPEQNLFDLGTSNQGALARSAQGMIGQVQGSYANPIDTSGAPGIASNYTPTQPFTTDIANSGPGAIKQAQDAAYRGQTQYLDPQFAQGKEALDNQLANQGVVQGSEAYNNAQNNFGLQKQRAYQSAQDSAVQAGNQEQNTLFGQGLAGSQLENSVQQQQFGQGVTNANLRNQSQAQYLQELFALRNQPLNEYNALATGSQVQQPAFSSVPQTQMAGTNVAGIQQNAFQNQMSIANAQNAFMGNLMGLGGSLGAAAIL